MCPPSRFARRRTAGHWQPLPCHQQSSSSELLQQLQKVSWGEGGDNHGQPHELKKQPTRTKNLCDPTSLRTFGESESAGENKRRRDNASKTRRKRGSSSADIQRRDKTTPKPKIREKFEQEFKQKVHEVVCSKELRKLAQRGEGKLEAPGGNENGARGRQLPVPSHMDQFRPHRSTCHVARGVDRCSEFTTASCVLPREVGYCMFPDARESRVVGRFEI